jgi:hypothetical protein
MTGLPMTGLWGAVRPLLAQTTHTYHRFARVGSLSEGWQWLLLGFICLVILAYVVHMYRRDSVELPRGICVLLIVLRMTAFAGILFYFLDLEKGSERTLVINSRVAVLVDVSQSMAQRDVGDTGNGGSGRTESVLAALEKHQAFDRLRQSHDVTVYSFADAEKPDEIASFPKIAAAVDPTLNQEQAAAESSAHLRQARITAWVALGLLVVACVAGLVYLLSWLWGRRSAAGEPGSWSLLTAMVAGIAAVVTLAVANLRAPDAGLPAIVGLSEPLAASQPQDESQAPAEQRAPADVDWRTALSPRGKDTRLGDALRYLVNQERGGPIAGFVAVSDGQSNAGVEVGTAITAAQEVGIPIHTIAVGGNTPPINVRVVDLEAPPRVYPGDRFQIVGYLQAFGLQGRTVKVELFSALAESMPGEAETFEQEKSVVLGEDGASLTVDFDVVPEGVGKRRFMLRVAAPSDDRDPDDNQRSANVEIVADKNRVLLIAGGPTREYRFLRNLLFRDRDTTSVVLLQSGQPGISQESDEIIYDFPSTEDEMFEYDCIVAFDPDWLALNEVQIRLLERWVSEQAGGLIVVAGPVYTPHWTRLRRGFDARADILKALYPVVFSSEGNTAINLGRVGGDYPWPLQFSRDGQSEKFLWLEDDAARSDAAWASFPGVYGYFAVRDVKKGARVYAHFSDPQERSLDDQQPIYLAGHFYGAGRVFFEASGEMWRLRAVDDSYFQKYYTKLVRWVSQGRLMRDSSRGVLLVDKERCFLGDTVTVNAVLTSAQREPLTVPDVSAVLVQPDGQRTTLVLNNVAEATQEGSYQGQFIPDMGGDYRVELAPPQSVADLLVREVHCTSSEAETRRPLRNDEVMQRIADRTRGQFYVGMEAAMTGYTRPGEASSVPSLFDALVPQDQKTPLPGTPDRGFKRLLSTWLLALIAGVLSLEWLIRRLGKLA